MTEEQTPVVIRLLSDLHLEPSMMKPHKEALIASLSESKRRDDTIFVLAGDIGDPYSDPYRRFMVAACSAYRHVLLVPGNHEYYSDGAHDMSVVQEHLARMAHELGFTLLDNNDVVIHGLRFVGSTCWPLVPEEMYKVLVKEEYGLVTRITRDSHKLDHGDFRKLHELDVRYLQETVRDSREPCVIITHYPPLAQMLDDRFEH